MSSGVRPSVPPHRPQSPRPLSLRDSGAIFFKRHRTAVVFFSLLAGLTVLRSFLVSIPLDRDEGEYAYIGWRWTLGEVPYVHSFDQKLPFILAVYSLIIRWIGTSPEIIHWVAHGWLMGALAVLFFLTRRLLSPSAGLWAAAFMALMAIDSPAHGQSANIEVFLTLPLLAGVFFLWNSVENRSPAAAAAAGILLGLTVLGKQNALFFSAGAFLFLLWRGAGLRSCLFFVGGLILPAVITADLFYRKGALTALWDATVRYNLEYAARLPFNEVWWNFWSSGLRLLRAFGLIIAAAMAYVLTRFPLRWDPPSRSGSPSNPYFFLVGWFLLGLAAAHGGDYFRHHAWFWVIPPLAIMAAGFLDNAPPPLRWKHHPLPAGAVVIVLQFFFAMTFNFPYFAPRDPAAKSILIFKTDYFASAPAIASIVRDHTLPEDPLFVFGQEPQVYFLSQRRSLTPYIFLYPVMIPSPSALRRQQEVIGALEALPPPVVVAYYQTLSREMTGCPPYLFQAFRDFIRRHGYRPIAVSKMTEERRTSLLTGPDAERAWRESPSWPDDPLSEFTIVVWKRPSAPPRSGKTL